MRTTRDRIRQAILFEAIALCLVAPLGALILDHGIAEIGALALAASLIATGWNYVYNLMFDRTLLRLTGGVGKSMPVRVLHALLFEAGLAVALVPLTAWWLGMSLWAAFLADLGIAAFYVVYAFVFTWIYDRVFPPPAPHGPSPA